MHDPARLTTGELELGQLISQLLRNPNYLCYQLAKLQFARCKPGEVAQVRLSDTRSVTARRADMHTVAFVATSIISMT